MTRTAITKLAATALAVASLGLTASAQAADQNIVAGENDIKVTPSAPANPGTPVTPDAPTPAKPAETAPAAQEEEKEIDYNSPEYFKSDEAKQRFERYCNMKDAQPSHNDAKFCEDFKKNNGTTTTTTTTGNHGRPDYCKYQNIRYDPKCDEDYGHKKDCHDYDKHDPYYQKYCYNHTTKKHYYNKGYEKPVYYNKTSEPSKGELPFTGLEIWQLGLLGLVLGGGGLGVRRLLAS